MCDNLCKLLTVKQCEVLRVDRPDRASNWRAMSSGMPETHLRYGLPLAVSRTGPGGLALRSTKSSMETVYSSFPGA